MISVRTTLLLVALPMCAPAAQPLGGEALRFEPNVGQAAADAAFVCRSGRQLIYLAPDAVRFEADGSILSMRLVNANPSAEAAGIGRLDAVAHYLIGDETKWKTNVPGFSSVEFRGVYPGVNVIYRSSRTRLEYDFELSPGADPSQIRIRFEGAEGARVNRGGDVVVGTGHGEFRHADVRISQTKDGTRRDIAGRMALRGPDEIVFEIGEYDRRLPLLVDPVITYSTYLGGSGQDSATSIALDAGGNTYVAGWTETPDIANVSAPSLAGSRVNAYVAKLAPAGSLIYITYFGGLGDDRATGVAVDSSGAAVLAGWTTSENLPVAHAAQARLGGGRDAFLVKLTPAGNAPVFATYLGGAGIDAANGIAVDSGGSVYVAGETTSTDFPVAAPVQSRIRGGQDAFIAKFSSSGVCQYATYLGGVYDDRAAAVAVDASFNVYVTGSTYSGDFPVLNAVQSKLGGGQDAFVTKLNSGGTALVYSTYLGGSGGEVGVPEGGVGIAVDSAGCAYVAGNTNSGNFPIVSPAQRALVGSADAFVTKLNASGSALVYSTYLGGTSLDFATGIVIDGSGAAYVSGYTASRDFPSVAAAQSALGGGYDAFAVKLNPSGATLGMATYLGGSGSDAANGIAVDPSGGVYLGGQTQSTNFPLASPVQLYRASAASAFVARLGTPANPTLVSPTAGTTLSAGMTTFTWTPVAGAQDYWIDIGTALNHGDIVGRFTGGAASFTVDLARYMTGGTIYVQLYSYFPSIGLAAGTGAHYQFGTTTSNRNPQLVSPAAGTVLATSTVTFTWSAVAGAQDYWIDVGTAPNYGDIAGGFTRGATSATVSLASHMTGKTIYVQLYSRFPGVSLVPGTGTHYSFTTGHNPELVSPSSGTVLSAPAVTFTWGAVTGAQDYWIDVGTAPRQGTIASGFTGGATSSTVNLSGRLGGVIYVQLYAYFPGVSLTAGTGALYSFATSTGPTLTAPPAGSVLSTPSVTLTWTATAGAENYWVDVGTAPLHGDIVGRYSGGATSLTVNLAPYLDGRTIYIQIYAKFPGVALVPGTGSQSQFATKKN